jgi:hypothetical protein
MEKTWKSTTAGVLSILAGSFGILGIVRNVIGQGFRMARPQMFHPFITSGNNPVIPFIAFAAVVGILAIIGGVFTLKRSLWGLALAGSIAAVFGSFPLGVIALVLTVLSKNEFTR